jgi:quinol monooxygenase YgiN
MLTVVAEIVAKPGKEQELRQQLLSMVEPTRQEEGCIQYDLHESDEHPGRFVFFENWTGADALERHFATPHLQGFIARMDELLAEPLKVGKYARIA